MNGLLNWMYTGPLRDLLRRMGIINLYALFGNFRSKYLSFQYNKNRPSLVEVNVNGYRASLCVSDESEYIRVMSVENDKHIIKSLFKALKPGDSFWDIGASVGLYTVLLAKVIGEKGIIVAFEPEEKSYNRLLQNIKNNNLNNVLPQKLALGKENKKMLLKVAGHYASGAHSLIELNHNNKQENNFEDVNVGNGDIFRLENNLEIPTAVKIDVEGAEEEVLIGLSKTLHNKKCRFLICEVHFSILASSGRKDVPLKIIDYLKDCGFDNLLWLDHSHLLACKT